MFNLDAPLLRFSKDDYYTIRDSLEGGIAIFGASGSGKSSTSGAAIATSLLRAKYGGMVMCVKQTEREKWLNHYLRTTNRIQDAIVISPSNPWRFNFLDYEVKRGGAGAGLSENIVELLSLTHEIVSGRQQQSGTETYFRDAMEELVRNTVTILTLSTGRLWLTDLYQFVLSAPVGDEKEDSVWQWQSFCWQCLNKAKAEAKTERDRLNVEMGRRYWLENFPKLADRTRSSIVSTLTSIADVLLHDFMHDLFCAETTITLEETFKEGKIVILDFPVREFSALGVVAQAIFKMLFQRTALRRDVNIHPRPVFLFCDEAHHFIGNDNTFLSESRESRATTVYITQNINNFYAALGAQRHDEVDAIVNAFSTKIFHASDSANVWAAEAIGQQDTVRKSWGAASNEFGGGMNIGRSEERDYKVNPALFTTLMKSSPASRWQSEAYVFVAGKTWQATGEPWLKVRFPQIPARQPETVSAEPPALMQTNAPQLSKEERFWFFLLLLEWLLIFYEQRYRIAELIGAERVQTLVWDELREEPSEALPAVVVVDLLDAPVSAPQLEANINNGLEALPDQADAISKPSIQANT